MSSKRRRLPSSLHSTYPINLDRWRAVPCRLITCVQRVVWLWCLALADRTATRALCLASRAADARPLLGTLFSYLPLHSVVTSATCVDALWAVWEIRRGISDSGIGSRCLQTKGSRLPPIPSALFPHNDCHEWLLLAYHACHFPRHRQTSSIERARTCPC